MSLTRFQHGVLDSPAAVASEVLIETKKGATTKKIARYQQFEAVNELVDRTVSLAGRPACNSSSTPGRT